MLSGVAETGRESAGENYEAIETAVMESKRGRWFLAEYAKRQRSDETSTILHALKRLEAATLSPSHSPQSAANAQQLQSMGRELMTRSEAVRRISAGLENEEHRHKLAGEADALRLLALSHELMCHHISDAAALHRQVNAKPPEPPLTHENIRFFSGDEDMFEAAPMGLGHEPMRAPMRHDQVSPPTKNRIVIIRHAAGEDPAIPLQGDPASSP